MLLAMRHLLVPRTAPKRAARFRAASASASAAPFVCPSCQQRPQRRFTSTATAPRSGLPPRPPPSGYALLTSRRLLSIAGPDAGKFLQGLITQSIYGPTPSRSAQAHDRNDAPPPPHAADSAPGFYSGILNAKGRVLHDVFIYRDTLGLSGGGDEAFVIEVDESQLERLLKQIKRYMLRRKLQVRALEDHEGAAWQVWDSDAPRLGAQASPPPSPPSAPAPLLDLLTTLQQKDPKSLLVLPDPRAPGLGYRVLTPGTQQPSSLSQPLDALELSPSTDAAYRVRRYLFGVAEGQAEIVCESALPLSANMDLMGGIDFRKGCYVGQELTIRTKHRGIVRKRVLPCALYGGELGGEQEPAPETLEYKPDAGDVAGGLPEGLRISREGKVGREAGNWIRGVGNIGLAMCRLESMTDIELPGERAAAPFDPENEFVMQVAPDEGGDGGRPVKVKAFVPDWLRAKLNETNEDHTSKAR
ncbi:Aminomethyltransferase folate-binding domain-containing protein [Whalleya microplaca]|nr:Aminomethyltransferase folate-binding domain-containing protein [Whalleya microplaca]